MEVATMSAATGAIGPVLRKLAAFLHGEYTPPPPSPPEVSHIEFIISKLEEMQSVLAGLWGREDLDTHCKDWMVMVRELSYDMDDDIDCFMQRSTTNTSKIFEDLKAKVMDVSGRFCDEWKTAENISNGSKPVVDPRGRFLHKDASELVGIGELKDELVQLLLTQGQGVAKPKPKPRQEIGIKMDDEIRSKAMRLAASTPGVELVRTTYHGKGPLLRVIGRGVDPVELIMLLRKKLRSYAGLMWVNEVEKVKRAEKPVQRLDELKIVCMVGYAGAGKTALADLLYQATREQFQCRAFVSVSPTTNITEVLTSILTQVTNSTYENGTEAVSEQYLIHKISNFLANTRYLVIIDDIWHTKEWRIIKQSLPKNNLTSRIIMTTRSNDIAEKCRSDDIDAFVYEIGVLGTMEAWNLSEDVVKKSARRFVPENVNDYHHNIVSMCYGMPLALICMSSALADQIQELDGDESQYLRALRRVEDGILSILCMKPLADSLCLGYDNLPPHLRTLLLYCSIYHWINKFERESLIRRWIAEGFVYEEEAARCFFDELISMEWIKPAEGGKYEIHPMMLAFLRCKSQEDNFVACMATGSDISSLCTSTRQIRRLSLQYGHSDLVKISKSDLELSYIRSVFVFKDASAVPFKRFQRLRVLELHGTEDLEYGHLVEICELLWLRYIGLEGTPISELPPEIGKLQRLETLDVRSTKVSELPPEIGKLQRLETLDVRDTMVSELPPEIGKLQHLKTLDVRNTKVRKLPPEIGGLHHLKTLDVRNTNVRELPWEAGQISNSVRVFAGDMEFNEGVSLPEDICQDLKANIPESSLAESRELLSIPVVVFDRFVMGTVRPHVGVFTVPGRRTHIPQLIKEHFSVLSSLDISFCKLDNERDDLKFLQEMPYLQTLVLRLHVLPREPVTIGNGGFSVLSCLDISLCKLDPGDLKFLQEMPSLQTLVLRLQVLPREPVTIGNGGFEKLESFYVDSRVPRVSFKPGAMPSLELLTFRFYAGPASEDPAVGITHLQSLEKVVFRCSPWYKSNGLGIAATIAAVRREAQEHPNRITVCINGVEEVFPQNDAGSSGASGMEAAAHHVLPAHQADNSSGNNNDENKEIVHVRRFEIGSSSRTSEIVEEVQDQH